MLEVRNLSTHFLVRHNPLARFRHPDHLIRAVDGVSFDVAAGEVFGIIGESGSGKTTLARSILRLVGPTSGDVLHHGRSVFAMNAAEMKQYRRSVQPVFQDADSTLDPRQHVGAILAEPLLIHEIGDAVERRRQISRMLAQVNLSPSFLQRHPSELSGGQRQRVALARSLLLRPEVLIADEPTSGLDPLVATQVLALMLRLKQDHGLTLVLISHDLDTVAYASDRIAVIYRGRIVELGGGDEFGRQAAHPYTRFLLGAETRMPDIPVIEGVHEHVHEVDEGCPYVHSCPHHMHVCHHTSPQMRETSRGHFTACHAIAPEQP